MTRGTDAGMPAGGTGPAVPGGPAGMAGRLLAAGAAEAARVASGLAGLDRALGAAILAGRQGANGAPPANHDPANPDPVNANPVGRLVAILQGVDLLRQEAEGLAHLLGRLAAGPEAAEDTADALIAALPLAGQRHRLAAGLAPGPGQEPGPEQGQEPGLAGPAAG